MLQGIIYTILVGFFWVVFGIIFSYIAKKNLNPLMYYFSSAFFMCLLFALFHVKWSVIMAGQMPRLGQTVLVMGLVGGCNIGGITCMVLAMRRGHHGVTWAINQSAMVVSFLASVLIWHNPVALKNYAGVVVILLAICIMGLLKTKGKNGASRDTTWLLLALGAFIILGFTQTLSTVPTRWPGWEDTANVRVAMFSGGAFIVMLVISIVSRMLPSRQIIRLALVGATLGFFSQIIFYKGMDLLEEAGMVSIVYPLAIGTCITGFAVYSKFALKEHFGFKEIAGIVLGLVGIGLISIN
jgi:drug/metabolite transporter (DMT)-like permease